MTVGSPAKTLFLFAVPMVLGNLFQQLYNIVDSIVVGNFVGADALAAVGSSATFTMLFVAVATGIGIGSSIVISQFFGSKRMGEMMTSIYTAIISMFTASLILAGIGLLVSGKMLELMNTPAEIYDDALKYLQIYFLGLPFLFSFNGLNAVFNSLGLSHIPLILLGVCSVLNILLDLLFVTQYGMGVAGVGWATLIAQAVSAFVSFIWIMLRLRRVKAEIKEKYSLYSFSILKEICFVAIPSMIQQSIVALGCVAVQGIVNSFGAAAMAGYAAAIKIDNIAIMPMINVGNAVSTFTAQNISAGKTERVKQGMRTGVIMSAVIGFVIMAVIYVFGENFIGAFMDSNANQEAIQSGVRYLRDVSMFYFLMGFMNTNNGVLRGSSDMKVYMISTLVNFSLRSFLAYVLSPTALGVRAISLTIPMGWTIGSIISYGRFRSGKWKEQVRITSDKTNLGNEEE